MTSAGEPDYAAAIVSVLTDWHTYEGPRLACPWMRHAAIVTRAGWRLPKHARKGAEAPLREALAVLVSNGTVTSTPPNTGPAGIDRWHRRFALTSEITT